MKIGEIYLLYEIGGKYFKTYSEAYFNRKYSCKPVYYVFTPTMEKFRRVCELYRSARTYFNKLNDTDYFDINTMSGFKQKELF